MKKEFNKAEIEVVRFEKTDVITTSSEDPTGCASWETQWVNGEDEDE